MEDGGEKMDSQSYFKTYDVMHIDYSEGMKEDSQALSFYGIVRVETGKLIYFSHYIYMA